MSKPRIAIVVQRYGVEVNGGAEQMARWLAEHLLELAEVHVLTTCALDYQTWADHYPAGYTQLNHVHLHRFPVDQPRDWQKAQQATYHIFNSPHEQAAESTWLKEQGPYSSTLFKHIDDQKEDYDLFLFFTYVYALTAFGLPKVAHKAIYIPCAHDEPALYLPVFRDNFHQARFIAYNTATEKQLVERVWGNEQVPNMVVGTGVEVAASPQPDRFRQKFKLESPYILYAGRIAASKNVPELLDFLLRYRHESGNDIKLVLLGRAAIELPADPALISTGFVSESDKYDAIAGAELVVVPSKYESLSIITMEAWLLDRPVLVNGSCQVLLDLVRNSHGGLFYTSYPEFKLTLQCLLNDTPLQKQLGQNGHRYAQQHYSWPAVLQKYKAIFAVLLASHP